MHPDAHACRLKIHLATLACQPVMQCPWDVTNELKDYVKMRQFVSASCRLTVTEERLLLDHCDLHTFSLVNRLSFLNAATNTETATATIVYPRRPRYQNFDASAGEDGNCRHEPIEIPAVGLQLLGGLQTGPA